MPQSDSNTPFVLEELNLLEVPLGAISPRVASKEVRLVFRDAVNDKMSGKRVTREFCVGHPRFTMGEIKMRGFTLPTCTDVDVLLAVQRETFIRSKFLTDEPVCIPLNDIASSLKWPCTRKVRKRICRSLVTWSLVELGFSHWRVKALEAWKPACFTVLRTLEIGGTESRDSTCTLSWNERIGDSVRARYTRKLDWAFYLSLKRPTTKRLYRFLEKRLYRLDGREFDMRSLCRDKVGISPGYSAGECRRRLMPAILELEEVGYLQPMASEQRFFMKHNSLRIRLRRKGSSRPKGRVVKRSVVTGGVVEKRELNSRSESGEGLFVSSLNEEQLDRTLAEALRRGPAHLVEGYRRMRANQPDGESCNAYRRMLIENHLSAKAKSKS